MKVTLLHRWKALASGLLGIVQMPVLCVPVEAQAALLEEVVVVARKRQESLQDTPVAVSAFNAEQLRAAQVTNIADLARQVPGLSNKDGDKVSGLTIRGVGARAVGAAIDPGVGVYVDGIFMPRSDTQLVDVVDMQSIQVLRGPQGTLFGKNTAGGAVLLESRKPTETLEWQLQGGFGDYQRKNFGLRVDGTLIDQTLLGALTYDRRRERGYMKDRYTGIDYGDVNRSAAVAQLRWFAGAQLTADLIALWGQRKENAAPNTCKDVNPGSVLHSFASTTPGSLGAFCEQSAALATREKVIQDTTGLRYTVTNHLLGLTLDWSIGDLSFKSVTGYLYQDDLQRNTDVDATPFLSLSNFSETARQLQGSGFDASNESRQFVSQEFDFFGSVLDQKVDYTLGVYLSDEKIKDQVDGQTLALGGWLGLPLLGSTAIETLPPAVVGFQPAQLVDFTSTSAAAFGQLIYNYSQMWQFTVGGRWTWEEKKLSQRNYTTAQGSLGIVTRQEMTALADFLQPIVVNPTAPQLQDAKSWTEFTPAATVTMFAPEHWTEGLLNAAMFYYTYSEGFKAGGFTTFGPDTPLAFNPETVKSNELGFKLELLSQRIRFNGAMYYMHYDDMQLGVTRQFGELSTRYGITNAGSAKMQGVELEVVMVPLDGLRLDLSTSFIDARYSEFDDEFVDTAGQVQLTDRSDEPFAYVPEQTYSWALQYDWQTKHAVVAPRVSGFYKDKVYTGLDPAAFEYQNAVTLDSYTLWNARLAVEPHWAKGLQVALFAKNLTNALYYGTGTVEAARLGVASRIRGKPRSYGIDIFYRW